MNLLQCRALAWYSIKSVKKILSQWTPRRGLSHRGKLDFSKSNCKDSTENGVHFLICRKTRRCSSEKEWRSERYQERFVTWLRLWNKSDVSKKRRVEGAFDSAYLNLYVILSTSNISEMVFSVAGHALRDRLLGIAPINFEWQLLGMSTADFEAFRKLMWSWGKKMSLIFFGKIKIFFIYRSCFGNLCFRWK